MTCVESRTHSAWIWVLGFKRRFWFCSEEDLLSLNTQELLLKTFPQCYERGCKRGACGNMAWRNRWLTHPLEHVHQCAALTNWTHRLPQPPWHCVCNWTTECWVFFNHTDKIQSTLFVREKVLCDAQLCILFHCRLVVIRVLMEGWCIIAVISEYWHNRVRILNADLQFSLT